MKSNSKKPVLEETYGIDGIYFAPMCPSCNEPTYSLPECAFCGQKFELTANTEVEGSKEVKE